MTTLLEFAVRLADLVVDGFLLAFTIAAYAAGLAVGAFAVPVALGVLLVLFGVLRLGCRFLYGVGLRLSGRPAPPTTRKTWKWPKSRTGEEKAAPEFSDEAIDRLQKHLDEIPPEKRQSAVQTSIALLQSAADQDPSAPPSPTITPIKTEMVATSPDGVEMTVDVSGPGQAAKMEEILGHLARAGFKETRPPAISIERPPPSPLILPPTTFEPETFDTKDAPPTLGKQEQEEAHKRAVEDLGLPPLRPGVPINPNPTGTEAWEKEELRRLAVMQDERAANTPRTKHFMLDDPADREELRRFEAMQEELADSFTDPPAGPIVLPSRKIGPGAPDPSVSMVDGPVSEQIDARDCATTDSPPKHFSREPCAFTPEEVVAERKSVEDCAAKGDHLLRDQDL